MNETKLIEKKVITLLLESNKSFFLSVQYAFSLEEAFIMAKMEFEKLNIVNRGANSLEGAKIGLFAIKSIKDLTEEDGEFVNIDNSIQRVAEEVSRIGESNEGDLFDILSNVKDGIFISKNKEFQPKFPPKKETKKIDPNQEKNILMKEIIKNKDRELLEKNKDLFTQGEIQYLEHKIDGSGK